MYANELGDMIKRFTANVTHVTVLGNVTYGSCCIDNQTTIAIESHLLIYYGPSCVVPLTATMVPIL